LLTTAASGVIATLAIYRGGKTIEVREAAAA